MYALHMSCELRSLGAVYSIATLSCDHVYMRLHMSSDHVCMVCRRVVGTICCRNMFQPAGACTQLCALHSSCVQWVTPVAILQKDELAHAINHTCDEDKVDVKLVNTSGDFEYNEEKGKWIEIEPIIVYVRSKRHVPSGNEIFGTYVLHESVQCVCHRCKRIQT